MGVNMDNHDAVRKLAEAYKTLGMSMTSCTQVTPLYLMGQARDIIYDVGENKFGKEFVEELRKSEAV